MGKVLTFPTGEEEPKPLAIRPQAQNSNQHTERGMSSLERSIDEDGWIDAITVAADDESISGSARVEVGGAKGWDFAHAAPLVIQAPKDRPIVIETDGSQPLINRRVDIPNASDPRAQRLGVAANRVSFLNFREDPGVLANIVDSGVDLSGLYRDDELAERFRTVPLPFDAVAPTEDELAPRDPGAPPTYNAGEPQASYIRMVQLFLTTETQPEFLNLVKALGRKLEQTTITDTVMEAVRYAYSQLVVPDAG